MSGLKRSLTITDVPAAKRSKSGPGSKRKSRPRSKMPMGLFSKPELKQAEVYVASTNLTVSTEFFCSGVAEGSTAITREGRLIAWKNFRMNLGFAAPVASTGGTLIHWAVVLDRQPNGAAATYANMFDGSVVTDAALRFKNTVSQDARFKVIKEGYVALGIAAGGPQIVNVNEFIDLSKLLPEDRGVKFSGTTAGIADVATNALYVVCAPSGQTTFADATTVPKVTLAGKLRFTDL